MTIKELKKLDKQFRQIDDPYGAGWPAVKRIYMEAAERTEIPAREVGAQYMAWKWSK